MKTVSISELKASLSEYLSVVSKGEEVLITDRGTPVARILKVEGVQGEEERRIRLARQGLLRLRSRTLRKLKPPPGKSPSGVLSALLEERREGR